MKGLGKPLVMVMMEWHNTIEDVSDMRRVKPKFTVFRLQLCRLEA